MQTLKVAILGFGNAGKAFGEMIEKYHEKIKDQYHTDIQVVAITTKTRGNILDENGLNLGQVLADLRANGKFTNQALLTDKDNLEIIKDVDFDLLVELTPLNIKNGEPAITHIKSAFLEGKSVVTANKGPIAWAYDQLNAMAKEAGVSFHFESTVMDGAPVFNMYDSCLRLAKVEEISGVLNTTTNYLLGQLEDGVSLDEALENGRKMGFVEADPSLDLDGWDGAAKITALANVLMKGALTPDQVERRGIAGITGDDLRAAKREGMTIKVMCRAWRDINGQVVAKVAPEKIPMTDKEALVDGTTSVVSLTTDVMGKITLFENDPEIYQTAYGVFGDMLRVIIERL